MRKSVKSILITAALCLSLHSAFAANGGGNGVRGGAGTGDDVGTDLNIQIYSCKTGEKTFLIKLKAGGLDATLLGKKICDSIKGNSETIPGFDSSFDDSKVYDWNDVSDTKTGWS